MKTAPAISYCNHLGTSRERGLVLFVALISLVVLSLAAVALIRSVDTSTIIAGNLAFKQSATNASEKALLQANKWMGDLSAINPAIPTGLYTGNASAGYYANTKALMNGAEATYQNLTDPATWTDAKSKKVTVKDCDGVPGDTDCAGNQIRYIIERMCELDGSEIHDPNNGKTNPDQHCLFGPQMEDSGSKRAKTEADTKQSAFLPIYRVTVRTVGPRNTVSFVQVFVY